MRTGLVKIAVVMAVLVSAVAPASAAVYGQVYLTETIVNPKQYMSVYLAQLAGPHTVYTSVYNVAIAPVNPLPFETAAPIGFCIEAAQWSSTTTQLYSVVDLQDTPMTQGPDGLPMGPAKADWLSRLFGKYYDAVLLRNDATYTSAFQLSIWEIVYDTPQQWDLTGGKIWVHGTNSATALATNWLSHLQQSDPLYGPGLIAFTNDDYQDYVTVKVVPEPLSVMLGAIGLGAVAAMRRLKKS